MIANLGDQNYEKVKAFKNLICMGLQIYKKEMFHYMFGRLMDLVDSDCTEEVATLVVDTLCYVSRADQEMHHGYLVSTPEF